MKFLSKILGLFFVLSAARAEVSSWTGLSSSATVLIERGHEHAIEVLTLRDAVIEDFSIEDVRGYGSYEGAPRETSQEISHYRARIRFRSEQLPGLAGDLGKRFACWTAPQPYIKLAPDLKSMEALFKNVPVRVLLSVSASNLQPRRSIYNQPDKPFLEATCKLGLHGSLEKYLESLRDQGRRAQRKELGPCRGEIGVDAKAVCLW